MYMYTVYVIRIRKKWSFMISHIHVDKTNSITQKVCKKNTSDK